MYKVIIFDEEQSIRRLLKRFIQWEDLNLDLVAEFEDGQSAFSFIEENKPDIAITDIRIPGIDGLEVIKRARESNLNTNFIIISGYKDFDYAFNAIKYNVENYLLKPIDSNELNEALTDICNSLKKNLKYEKDREILENKLKGSINSLKKRLVEEIFDGKLEIKNISQLNNEFQLKFKSGIFQVIMFKIDILQRKQQVPFEQMKIIYNKIGDIAINLLKNDNIYIEKCIYKNALYCILNFDSSVYHMVKDKYKSVFYKASAATEMFQDLTITLAVGKPVSNICDLYHALLSARESLCERITIGTDRIIYYDGNVSHQQQQTSQVVNMVLAEKLITIIKAADENSLSRWVRQLINSIRNEALPSEARLSEYESLLQKYFSVMNEINPDCINYITKDQNNMIDEIYNFTDFKYIEEYVCDVIMSDFHKWVVSKNLQLSRPVKEAKEFIKQNYSEELSLKYIASKIYLHPVYFSVMFKNEVGMNISKYIINVRIDKAKELLKEMQYSLPQIAEMVGYKDYKHFSKLFAKEVGLSPNKYRKLYRYEITD